MFQEKLNSIAILSIEDDLIKPLFDMKNCRQKLWESILKACQAVHETWYSVFCIF